MKQSHFIDPILSNPFRIHRSPMNRRKETPGFTLAELLVVLAIIGLLAAILLPTLAGARRRAEGAACKSNLRQITLGAIMYTEDADGQLPWNLSDSYYSLPFDRVPGWTKHWLDYDPNNHVNTNESYLVGLGGGRLGAHNKDVRSYHCPSDRSVVTINGTPYPRTRSYSMNWFMGNHGTGFTTQRKSVFDMAWMHEVSRPSHFFYFIDEQEDSLSGGYFLVADPVWGDWYWGSLPGSRHGPAANMSFLDGHVETKRWQDKRTLIPVVGKKWTQSPRHPGNQDIVWLRERATIPLQPSP